MINSINFIDGLDGLSSGIALIAAVTLGLISLTTAVGRRPAVHRRPVLRPRRGPARVPALELPPGVDLRRDERRDVRRLHARRAVDPRHGQGRGGAARPRRADHRHVLDHRPAAAPAAARRSRPDRGHIHHRLLDLGPAPPPDGPRSSTGSASVLAVLSLLLSGAAQLYAFLGVVRRVRARPVPADRSGHRPGGPRGGHVRAAGDAARSGDAATEGAVTPAEPAAGGSATPPDAT